MEHQPSHSKKNVELRLNKKLVPKSFIGNLTKIMGGCFFYRFDEQTLFIRPIGPRYTKIVKTILDEHHLVYKEEAY